jgi:sterol desaturase/sphingolipid hydroxylase (fatty acid hydroxylase superfamily)
LIFEVVLNGSALFNHANLSLPKGLDRLLRLMVVTPDMHRVHHSVIPQETHSNFGFCFPWWDRLFATYCPQPKAGHQAMTLGLPQFRSPADQGLWAMLRQPWR